MRSPLVLLLALALFGPALTGCLGLGGGSDDADAGLDTKSRANVSSDTGGIEGVVTDSAVQPVADVEVTVTELSASTSTKDDGSFAFSDLQPGTYTLNFTRQGLIPSEQEVDVDAGSVSTVEVVMAHAPTVEPYSQQFQFEGFLECSVSSPVVAVAVCAIPNFVLGGNATNDRFIFYHPIEENPWQIVTEMTWEPAQPAAERLSMLVEPQGLPNDDKTEYGDDVGTSPLIVRADRQRMVEVTRNTTAVCEGDKEPGSSFSAEQEAYCNRDPIEEGGRVQIRAFVSNREAAGEDLAGAAVQQDFTVFQTIFYNTPACEDYSLVEGNECAQMDQPPGQDPYEEISGGSGDGGGGNRTR